MHEGDRRCQARENRLRMLPRTQQEQGESGSCPVGGRRRLTADEDVPDKGLCSNLQPSTLLPLKTEIRPTNHTSPNTSPHEVHAFEVTSSLPTGCDPPQDTCQNAHSAQVLGLTTQPGEPGEKRCHGAGKYSPPCQASWSEWGLLSLYFFPNHSEPSE